MHIIKVMGVFLSIALAGCYQEQVTIFCDDPANLINMSVGEQVKFQGTWEGEDISVSFWQKSETEIEFQRIEGLGEEAVVNNLLFKLETDGCVSYKTEQQSSPVERLLIQNAFPRPGWSPVFNQDDVNGELDASPPPVDYYQNYSCTDEGIYRTCQADFELENNAYHWRRTSITEDVKPGLGITAFSLQENQIEVISIEMTEWNGI